MDRILMVSCLNHASCHQKITSPTRNQAWMDSYEVWAPQCSLSIRLVVGRVLTVEGKSFHVICRASIQGHHKVPPDVVSFNATVYPTQLVETVPFVFLLALWWVQIWGIVSCFHWERVLVLCWLVHYSRTLVYLSVVVLVFPSRLLDIHIVFMNMNVRMLYLHLHTRKTRKHLWNGHSFQTHVVDL